LNKKFKQPRRIERRRERVRLRGLRHARRKRWLWRFLWRFLLTVWYVLLVFATVSTVYHLTVGF
jgi:hypothetical protein